MKTKVNPHDVVLLLEIRFRFSDTQFRNSKKKAIKN